MLNQSLSALMDGELDEREIEVLLERIRHDPELRAAWGRQHYLRISICERPPHEIDGGFADHIMSRIAAEEAELNARAGRMPLFHKRSDVQLGARRRGWHRPVAGLAVAASVAVVAVLVLDQGSVSTTATTPAVATTTAVTASAPHAERVARSEAAAQAGSGATVAVSAQQPATAAGVPETHQAVQKIEEVAGATTGATTKVVATTGSTTAKPVAINNRSSDKTSAADITDTQLEQLIGTKKSPLSWDAASAAQEQQLRSLIPKYNGSDDSDASGPSSLLGYMHMTSDQAAATTTATASATKDEAAPQH